MTGFSDIVPCPIHEASMEATVIMLGVSIYTSRSVRVGPDVRRGLLGLYGYGTGIIETRFKCTRKP